MNKLLKTLLLGGSASALAAGAAMAQSALEIEEIQSSVSRIDLKGFEAPTPVTVVGIEQIQRDARVQLGDQIRDLPQVRGTGGSLSAGSVSGNLVQINAGVDSVQIRGLGAQRNLVLFDRQRVVSDTIQENVVNLSLIPSSLVQRVDVVTGGASASWGSDAVTGVINIVINKTFEGFKGSVTYSDSSAVTKPVYKLSLAWGTSFLDGRGHTVVGWDYTRDDHAIYGGEVDRAYQNNGRSYVYNTAYCNAGNIVAVPGTSTSTCASRNAGQPLLVYAYGVGNTQNVVGGLVNNNTVGQAGSGLTATTALKGVMFSGENATPTQFNYGTIYNANSCYNGCTNDQFGSGGWGATNPYHSSVFFNYTSFQILPDLKASVQLNFSRLSLRGGGGTINGNGRVIAADNPYLPTEIAGRFVCNPAAPVGVAACAAGTTVLSNGYNPFTKQYEIGVAPSGASYDTLDERQARPSQTLNMGFEFSGNRMNSSPSSTTSVRNIKYDYEERCDSILQNCGYYHKQMARGVFTLEGVIGDSWSWNSYILWGQARVKENLASQVNIRVANALDAVRITSGNQGTSGLPIGSVQCRGLLNETLASQVPTISVQGAFTLAEAASLGITRASEVAGCVPFNPFGTGEASNATRNYIQPGLNPAKSGTFATVLARSTQTAAAFTLNGVLPWQLPAGEIGVATGAEWRMERSGQYNIDPRSQIGMYGSGNFGRPYEGKLHAEEGFLEVAIPILKNDIVQSLSIDLAGRLTHYSNSGLSKTWKIGLQSQINDDLRFRMTWSADIRAPNIYELFAGPNQSQQQCASFIDGPTGSNDGKASTCFAITRGLATLTPETANTLSAGFVITPTFVEGLTMSVDWYQIVLKNAIVTPGQTEALTRCKAGELVYCSQLVFTNPVNNQSFRYPNGTNFPVTQVERTSLNAGSVSTGGVDFNIAYGFDLFTGQMDLSANGNYVYDFSRTQLGVTYQGAGCSGGACYYSGGAKFEGALSAVYREDAWTFGVNFDITGESVMDLGTQGQPGLSEQIVRYSSAGIPSVTTGQRNLITGAETNYNAAMVRTDLRVQYRWNNNITLYAAVDNVQGLPMFGQMRRQYRGGVRFNY